MENGKIVGPVEACPENRDRATGDVAEFIPMRLLRSSQRLHLRSKQDFCDKKS